MRPHSRAMWDSPEVICGHLRKVESKDSNLRSKRCNRCHAVPAVQVKYALTHDLVGAAILQWFRQLRRTQSYCHSIKAGKLNNNTMIYRTELWTSIRRASGFQGGFSAWWEQQDFIIFCLCHRTTPIASSRC